MQNISDTLIFLVFIIVIPRMKDILMNFFSSVDIATFLIYTLVYTLIYTLFAYFASKNCRYSPDLRNQLYFYQLIDQRLIEKL